MNARISFAKVVGYFRFPGSGGMAKAVERRSRRLTLAPTESVSAQFLPKEPTHD